jgi:hypothetical protein
MNAFNNRNTATATAPNTSAPNTTQRPSKGNKDQDKKVKVSVAIKPEVFQTKKGIRALYEKTKALKLD